MAQSDFLFNAYQLATDFAGSGEPVYHESLSNPLQGEGTYCRYWKTDTNLSFNFNTKGVFVRVAGDNIPNRIEGGRRALSLRSWVRIPSDLQEFTLAGFKVKSDFSRTVGRTGNSFIGGYRLIVYQGGLYTEASAGVDEGQEYTVSGFLANVPVGQWFKMRMDVTPINRAGVVDRDRISYYLSDGAATGEEVWTKIGQRYVAGSDLIPWDSPSFNANGFFVADQNSGEDGHAVGAYFDRFQIYVISRD
jgi:hypothetical protein